MGGASESAVSGPKSSEEVESPFDVREVAQRTLDIRIRESGAPATLDHPVVIANPYCLYRQMRAVAPIVRCEQFFSGAWMFLDHHDISAISRDWKTFSNAKFRALIDRLPQHLRGEFEPLIQLHSLWMVFEDPPQHTLLRGLMSRGFSRNVIDDLAPFIRQTATAILARLKRQPDADLIHEFATQLPMQTIAKVMGFSEEDLPDFARWTGHIAAYMGSESPHAEVMAKAQDAMLQFEERFRRIISERLAAPPREDFLGLMLTGVDQGKVDFERDLFAQCTLICFTGSVTTKNLIGNAIYTLLQHPRQMARLIDNPELVPDSIEEVLRFECPVQFLGRFVPKATNYEGTQLDDGSYVILMIGAANRDPGRYSRADEFDVTRQSEHISFGEGVHGCLGQGLARLEAQVAISEFLKHLPHCKLDSNHPARLALNPGLRGFETLPVRIDGQ